MKKLFMVMVISAVFFVGWLVWHNQQDAGAPGNPNAAHGFDKKQFSLNDPASLWVVTNKQRTLQPASYEPADLVTPDVQLRLGRNAEEMQLRKAAATALQDLFAAASGDGIELQISSAYRSYGYQKNLYNHYVDVQGRETADTQSARPGYSEHQTGLAVDVEPTSRECEVEACFGDLPEGKWVADNAYKYGFIIRYPKDMQHVTGYIYEPWHIRFVGTALSSEMNRQRVTTMEQFFGLENAPDYE
ncbi:MAG TPA: M15 family metallopeptidase [Candidatus Saccharimonadales bacterium]|nr:M15 family metallopeptidase [Candidatus Saccharimonadales bacterium]